MGLLVASVLSPAPLKVDIEGWLSDVNGLRITGSPRTNGQVTGDAVGAVIVTSFVYHAANRPDLLPRELLPAQTPAPRP